MDLEFVRKALGETGIAGLALAALGIVVFGSENRREGFAALVLVVGTLLITLGLMGGFLRSMDMELQDLH